MSVACRACGHRNPAGAAACGYCRVGAGATPPLGTRAPAAPAPPHAPAGHEGVAIVGDEEYRPPAGSGWAFERFQRAYATGQVRREYPRGAIVPARSLAPPAPPAGPVPVGALKDPGTGLVLEMLPAFFGFYGIGYLWAGEVGLGLALLLGNWALWFAFGLFAVFFSVFTFGLGLLCLGPLLPLVILLYFIGPVISGLALQRRLRARRALAAGGRYP